jgi:hypothetical protein
VTRVLRVAAIVHVSLMGLHEGSFSPGAAYPAKALTASLPDHATPVNGCQDPRKDGKWPAESPASASNGLRRAAHKRRSFPVDLKLRIERLRRTGLPDERARVTRPAGTNRDLKRPVRMLREKGNFWRRLSIT